MKLERCLSLLAALTLASCSEGPSSPTATSAAGPRLSAVVEGLTGAAAVTTTRLRLRRVGAGDIQTGLITGQVISVPVNVNLDVWAEIVRLETDRARLLVDWGNGNVDHTGCGSCRLENVYKKEGRYTLTAKVIDLNAAPGLELVTQATVTINVVPPVTGSILCDAAGTDFESLALFTPAPVIVGGAKFFSPAGAIYDYGVAFSPYAMGNVFAGQADTTLTIQLEADKTSFGAGFLVNAGGTANYQAFSATGAVVASGALNFTAIPASTVLGSIVGFSSSTPFRTVVIDIGGTPGFAIDNVSASCK